MAGRFAGRLSEHFEEITFDEAQDAISDDKDAEADDNFQFKPREKGSFKKAAEKRHSIIVPKGTKKSVTRGGKSSKKKRAVKRAG